MGVDFRQILKVYLEKNMDPRCLSGQWLMSLHKGEVCRKERDVAWSSSFFTVAHFGQNLPSPLLFHIYQSLDLILMRFNLCKSCVGAKLLQSCPSLCNPMDCSPPGHSVHGILQARILEWVAMTSSRGPSWPRDWTFTSPALAGGFFTPSATWGYCKCRMELIREKVW